MRFNIWHARTYEPQQDKTNNVTVCPAKTQISLSTTQSAQSLHCVLIGYLRTQGFFLRSVKTLIRQGGCLRIVWGYLPLVEKVNKYGGHHEANKEKTKNYLCQWSCVLMLINTVLTVGVLDWKWTSKEKMFSGKAKKSWVGRKVVGKWLSRQLQTNSVGVLRPVNNKVMLSRSVNSTTVSGQA